MGNYIPPYTISEKMLEQVSAISEKIGKITSHRELESKPHLRRNNRIRSIHSSLKIEANSLSLNEVRDVINGHLVIGDQKEIQEVKNAYATYEKISEIDPSSAKQLKELLKNQVFSAKVMREYSPEISAYLSLPHPTWYLNL